jgi:hypothetical protein
MRASIRPPAPSAALAESGAALTMGIWACVLVAVGLLLSGPAGFPLANAIAPQPRWTGPDSFMEHYDFIQAAPYFFGFLMLVGFPALHVSILAGAPPRWRPLATLSLILVAVFAALIGFNYIAQTTIVPGAVRRGGVEGGAVVALLTMSNPSAVCWAIEMYGYGFLGLASACAAPCFGGSRVERAAATLLVANGVVSVLGAGLTSYDPDWVQTTAGLVAFGAWNLLVLAMLATIITSLARRRAQSVRGIAL